MKRNNKNSKENRDILKLLQSVRVVADGLLAHMGIIFPKFEFTLLRKNL
jgi:hypothetical protein